MMTLFCISFTLPGQECAAAAGLPGMTDFLFSSPGKGAGSGKPADAGQQDKSRPDPSDDDAPQGIASPDSPLTGDTGNMELGQTDLGASGTGAEDPLIDGNDKA